MWFGNVTTFIKPSDYINSLYEKFSKYKLLVEIIGAREKIA